MNCKFRCLCGDIYVTFFFSGGIVLSYRQIDMFLAWIQLIWEEIPLCNGALPVNKSADDPESHKELNHQGQVHFSYETCLE